MADLIEVKNFKISFAGKTVIKNLSFSIKKGEIFGLLGSNGCGKTTTIRTLLGLYRADSGKLLIIDVDNLDFANKPEDLSTVIDKIDAELHGLF